MLTILMSHMKVKKCSNYDILDDCICDFKTNFKCLFFSELENLGAPRPPVLVPRFARCPSVTFCD